MQIDVHGYTSSGSISAAIDGMELTVPDDIANRHRQMIAEWVAQGHVIPAYVDPGPTTEQQRALTFKQQPDRADLLTRLQSATPAQIDTYVDNNVTTLAQARAVMKAILKVIALDGRS